MSTDQTADETVDVAVIGAGPAGAVTAQLLARQRPDLSVTLWEAQQRPAMRPCGEFLSPDGLRVLAAAGLEQAVLDSGATRLTGLDLVAPRGRLSGDYRPWLGQAPLRDHGLGLRRERFDLVLQEAAAEHCRLQRGMRLLALLRSADGWLLSGRSDQRVHRLHARLVIGADGRQSAVRRLAGLDRPDRRRRFGLMCRAHGIPHGRHGEMHLGPLGQVGLAPLGQGEVNLNLLLAERSAVLLKHRSAGQLMRAALRGTPSLRARSAGARLGPVLSSGRLPHCSRSVVDAGLALVGDAGAFCDPFTGEGICFALQGAELLAGHLSTAIPDSGPIDASALAPYAADWQRRFGPHLRLGAVLQRILAHRSLAEHVVSTCGRFETCNRLFIAITGDYARLIPRRGSRTRF